MDVYNRRMVVWSGHTDCRVDGGARAEPDFSRHRFHIAALQLRFPVKKQQAGEIQVSPVAQDLPLTTGMNARAFAEYQYI